MRVRKKIKKKKKSTKRSERKSRSHFTCSVPFRSLAKNRFKVKIKRRWVKEWFGIVLKRRISLSKTS